MKTQIASLYVHIPFCVTKCLFCSFVVSIGKSHRVDDYIQAVITESRKYKDVRISTVYLGGGTPTFLDERQLSLMIENIRDCFDVGQVSEWTIEANPENLDIAKAKFLKARGFNRLSIGVQSFDDRYLKFLGRNHDRKLALRSYDNARDAGFGNINLDLMFGFPGQTLDELSQDLGVLTQLQSEHVSLYNLTVEGNSRFHVKQLKLDDEESLAGQYVHIVETLESRGLRQYEVSNFARPGFESRHNSNYWNGVPYVGLGVGAHGFLDHRRYWNAPKLQDYMARITSKGEAIEGFEDLGKETLLMERVLFGLRKNEGIIMNDIQQEVGLQLDDARARMLEQWVLDGFLVKDKGRIKTSMKGRLVLDELSSRLI